MEKATKHRGRRPEDLKKMHKNKEFIESIFNKCDLIDYKWIDPKKIIVSQWVRLKCMFGCEDYGGASCPPNVPSVEDCRTFFHEYTNAVIFKFENNLNDPSDHKKWAKQSNSILLKVERDVFLGGYQKAFITLMSTCNFCKECIKDRRQCKKS